jgi:hypothetical protein
MDQFDPFQSTDLPSSTNQLPDLDPDPVQAPELASPEPLALPPLAIYPTREALHEAIQSWSKLWIQEIKRRSNRSIRSGIILPSRTFILRISYFVGSAAAAHLALRCCLCSSFLGS